MKFEGKFPSVSFEFVASISAMVGYVIIGSLKLHKRHGRRLILLSTRTWH